jgi:hypothetical protein
VGAQSAVERTTVRSTLEGEGDLGCHCSHRKRRDKSDVVALGEEVEGEEGHALATWHFLNRQVPLASANNRQAETFLFSSSLRVRSMAALPSFPFQLPV